jgi:hypothetical protein
MTAHAHQWEPGAECRARVQGAKPVLGTGTRSIAAPGRVESWLKRDLYFCCRRELTWRTRLEDGGSLKRAGAVAARGNKSGWTKR